MKKVSCLPAISAPTDGAQVVNILNNHTYQMDEAVLGRILLREEVKDLPVVVVSVAGAYRSGKSFLLNFFLRYLTAPEETRNESGDWMGAENEVLKGFSWRGGADRNTTGLLMWPEPIVASLPSGDKVVVLLIDTQGTFDAKSTMRDCSTIFALSTLISSVQIYNIKINMGEDDLQHLQLFTEYGKLIKNDDGHKAFQVLQFLIRDWEFEYSYAYGREGGERMLAERLEVTEDMPQEQRELRQHIRSSFETVTCFLMPHPGRKVLKECFTGTLSEIEAEFKDALKELVLSIFAPANLTPKLINGERVKARDLFTYFKTYMRIFNSDKTPSPVSIMKATSEAALLSAVRDARELYEDRMERINAATQPSLPREALDNEHRNAVAAAQTAFTDKRKMATKKESDAYLAQMTQELEERLPQFVVMNEVKLRNTIEEAKEAYEASVRSVHGKNLLCLHTLDLDAIHNDAVSAALALFDSKRKRLPNMVDSERNQFNQALQMQLEFLRDENEQHNKLATLAVRVEYSAEMEALLTYDPPLDDKEFNVKYGEATAKAIATFERHRNRSSQYDEDSYKFDLLQAMSSLYLTLLTINNSKNKQAFQKALDNYTTHMRMFWKAEVCCLHPDDLKKAHEVTKPKALALFHPHHDKSGGDDEKGILEQLIQSKYYQLREQNDSYNRLAISAAVSKYISEMNYKCQASVWWVLIIPAIISIAKLPIYHRESKEAALLVFYNKRRESSSPEPDRYLKTLNEKIIVAYSRY